MCDILHFFPYKCLWLLTSLRGLGPKQSLVLAKEIETIVPPWEFLSSRYLNVGCIAGGTAGVLLVLVFAFNFWECLMEARRGDTEREALLTAMRLRKVQRCVPQLCALGEICYAPCCLSTVKTFRQDTSNKGTVWGNRCTKQYAVLWQSITRIFCPGTITVTTNQYCLPFRRATPEPSVRVQ